MNGRVRNGSSATGRPKTVMVVYGTRPEAVKMAPLVNALHHSPYFTATVAVTGQHRSMLDQVNAVFGIVPDVDLDIHTPGQSLSEITARSLTGITPVLERLTPDVVAVQGDTTTTFAVALAAFYTRVPVVHLEAGLRTHTIDSPFPEELNRRLTTRLTALHLPPTSRARQHLLAEAVDPDTILVTGNTVIDALHWTLRRLQPYGDPGLAERLRSDRPVLLVTAHRRESWGPAMEGIGRAVARIAARYPDYLVVLPLHANPLVRQALLPSLAGLGNVVLTGPLPYGGFCRLLQRSTIVLTDSGGVQEEGPSLGKPVLVMRDRTERPEAVAAGAVRLVGTDEDAIVTAFGDLADDPVAYARMSTAVNPYGDGRAAERSVAALAHFFGLGPRPEPFRSERVLDLRPYEHTAALSLSH